MHTSTCKVVTVPPRSWVMHATSESDAFSFSASSESDAASERLIHQLPSVVHACIFEVVTFWGAATALFFDKSFIIGLIFEQVFLDFLYKSHIQNWNFVLDFLSAVFYNKTVSYNVTDIQTSIKSWNYSTGEKRKKYFMYCFVLFTFHSKWETCISLIKWQLLLSAPSF